MPISTEAPSAKQIILTHPAALIALGFGSGLSPKAPGTVGTAWAWLTYYLLLSHLSDSAIAVIFLLSLIIGWWACKVTCDKLHATDPGAIVWDEVVAFWLILWIFAPTGFWQQALAFALFRFFDAAKPQPVRWADQTFKGGGWRGAWGIMWDDLVAAFCTLLCLAFAIHFLSR